MVFGKLISFVSHFVNACKALGLGWDYFEILAICENNRKEFLKPKRSKNLRNIKETIKTQLKIRVEAAIILLRRKTIKGTCRYHKHCQTKLYV